MKLLIVSNGHGEDIIGAALAQELAALGYTPQAVPLVGRGGAYEKAGFEVLGPRRELPSGGFTARSLANLWADLRAGWFSMSLKHYQSVRKAATEVSATLVVGDVYALLVASLFGRRPLFLMQCQSSVRALAPAERPYSVSERLLMRRARRVYPREAEAADWLVACGLANVRYLGNPMLDALEGVPLELPPPYLLLLPGSRSDAYESLPRMLEVCRHLRETGLTPVVAWAALPLEPLRVQGWTLEATGPREGLTHLLHHPDGSVVYLTQKAFKTALGGARVAISTSGTAAEQAAGYGVPVVSFPTGGPQYTRPFAEKQKRLLGDALALVEPDAQAIFRAVQAFLEGDLRERARAAGRAAMGLPGAARRIALDLHQQLEARQGPF